MEGQAGHEPGGRESSHCFVHERFPFPAPSFCKQLIALHTGQSLPETASGCAGPPARVAESGFKPGSPGPYPAPFLLPQNYQGLVGEGYLLYAHSERPDWVSVAG